MDNLLIDLKYLEEKRKELEKARKQCEEEAKQILDSSYLRYVSDSECHKLYASINSTFQSILLGYKSVFSWLDNYINAVKSLEQNLSQDKGSFANNKLSGEMTNLLKGLETFGSLLTGGETNFDFGNNNFSDNLSGELTGFLLCDNISDELRYEIQQVQKEYKLTDEELRQIVCVVYAETSSDNKESCMAVISAAINRMKSDKWSRYANAWVGAGAGNNLYGTVIAPGQFAFGANSMNFLKSYFESYKENGKTKFKTDANGKLIPRSYEELAGEAGFEGIIEVLFTGETTNDYCSFLDLTDKNIAEVNERIAAGEPIALVVGSVTVDSNGKVSYSNYYSDKLSDTEKEKDFKAQMKELKDTFDGNKAERLYKNLDWSSQEFYNELRKNNHID